MIKPLTIECAVQFGRRGRDGRKEVRRAEATAVFQEPGRVPRVSRLMALAIRFDGLIRDAVVADYAELARLGHVTRARITQIMNLLMLSPEIQEKILFLPRVARGVDPIHLRYLLPIAAVSDWRKQAQRWNVLCATHSLAVTRLTSPSQ